MELEFNRYPPIDPVLKDWSNVFPSIKDILSEDPATFEGGEWACFEWKAGELAKLHEVVIDKDEKKSSVEYILPEDQIISVLNGYGGSSWVADAPEKLKEKRERKIIEKIKEVRENEERERSYVNNIVRDWKQYDTPKADKGEYVVTTEGITRTIETVREDGSPLFASEEVCRTPFVLCGVSESLKNDEVYYKIRYLYQKTDVREFWASQNALLAKKELRTLLVSKSINCPENTILNETLEYISRSIAEFGPRYKKECSTNQCGWNANLSLFVLGEKSVSNKGINPVLAVGSGKGFPELVKTGTVAGWVEGVQELMNYDVLRFKCYDALTAILKRPLGIESHVSDHYGNTSVGKTFTSKVALSMVGDPEGLTLGAKSSYKGILVTVRDFSDLPLLIDESSDAGEHLADLVYPLTSDKGRVKSTQDGKRDGGEEYHTSIMFTGEKPIRDCLKNSGQQYRVNEFDDTLPDLPTKEINRVKRAIRDNHGHVIESYIQEVLKKVTDGSLNTLYDDCFESLPDNTSNIEGRSRSIFACIMTAGEIIEPIFKKMGINSKNPREIVNKYYKKCIVEKPVELEYIRALRVVLDWISSDYGNFLRTKVGYDDGNVIDKKTTYGFVNDDYIDIIESEFTKKMKLEGFSPMKIKEDWVIHSITIVNDSRKIYRTSNKKYGPYAAIRIHRTIAGELVGYNLQKDDGDVEEIPEFDQFEKINLILDTINLLTRARKKAEIKYIKKILPIPEIDDYLLLLKTKGQIFQIDQYSYKTTSK